MIINELLQSSFEKYPDKPFLIYEDGQLTYKQVYFLSKLNAAKLVKLGINSGERVLLYASNGPEFVIGYFALQFIGAIPAPANPSWTMREVNQACKQIGCNSIIAETSKLKLFEDGLNKYRIFSVSLEYEGNNSFAFFQSHPDNPAHIRFTSGTTNAFKPVLLSQRNLTWRLRDPGTHCQTEDVFLCPVAFPFRILKLLIAAGVGATIVSIKNFSLKAIVRCLREHRVSWIWGSPAIYRTLTLGISNKSILRNLRGVCSVGSYLPPRIQTEFENKFDIGIYQHYGLSEGMDAAEMPTDIKPLLGSVGRPCKNIEFSVEKTGQNLGEIVYRGPNIMLGYIKEGDPSELEPVPNGWLRTGDLGYFDNDGFLYISGRLKKVINVDGLKLTPMEVENIIYDFPGVELVKVVGKPDFIRGEVPIAYVVVQKKYSYKGPEIKKYCQRNLESFKVPREVHIVDKIPMGAHGKIE